MFCSKCVIVARHGVETEHCEWCNYCVEKIDHHCPWSSKCIAAGNMCWFQFFLWMTGMLFIYAVVATLYLGFNEVKEEDLV
jgi:hypothetical protein